MVETSQPTAALPLEAPTIFLSWRAVIAGALVAAALSLVLITFGSAIGLSVASTAPTWRDTSSTLAMLSGLYLLLTSVVSFGCGGYVAGRLRTRWTGTLHNEFVEFRDGTHGLVSWALAVVISGIAAAIIASSIGSKAVPTAAAPSASAGEALLAYDLDRLFRSDRRPQGDLSYTRAEADRILLAATSREGMKADDRAYLVRLIATQTGIAPPEAEKRVDEAVAAAQKAVKNARRSGVILGFSIAVSLLLGAVVAWYAACLGGQHRDQAAPPLRWNLARP
jgi:hypothetical protein